MTMSKLFEDIKKEVASGGISEYSEFQAKLAEFKSEVPDASTKDGYNRAKEVKGVLTSIRTAIETKRKEYKAPILQLGKMIDSEAKRIIQEVKEVEDPFHEAYKAIDDEKKRIKLEIENRFVEIKGMASKAIECDSSDIIESMINDLAEYDVSKETFGRRVDEASALVAQTLERLSELHAKQVTTEQERIRVEQERLELEKLRKEAAEREAEQERIRKEEEQRLERERIEKQAAEQARLQEQQRQEQERLRIEQQAREAEEREKQAKRDAELAEQRRIEEVRLAEEKIKLAEEQAKRDAEEAAEKARLAEVQRQKEEQDRIEAERLKREENKRHVGKICKQSKEDLMNLGLEEEHAKAIVSAIAKGQIRNISIQY